MVLLDPAPDTLNLAAPLINPWFDGTNAPANLAVPNDDLSVTVNFSPDSRWFAPGNSLLSYHIATPSRPAQLAHLRDSFGAPAFTDNAVVMLLTLMPEVEDHWGRLSNQLPRADSADAPDDNVPAKPVIRYFALEISGSLNTIAGLQTLLPADILSEYSSAATDEERARLLGLKHESGAFKNATPASILRSVFDWQSDDMCAMDYQPAGTGSLSAKLWCFDRNGRPVDPGSVAAMLTRLADVDWENLWSNDQREETVTVTNAHIVHFVNAHEGPLSTQLQNRLTLNNMTAIGTSTVLYQTSGSGNPSIALTQPPNDAPDTAPVARLAALPMGAYQDLANNTVFDNWNDTNATTLARDYQRIAVVDIENHLTGLQRQSGNRQDDADLRLNVLQNRADPLFIDGADALAQAFVDIAAIDGSEIILPELDAHFGAQTVATIGNANPFDEAWDELQFTEMALIGSGMAMGPVVINQSIALVFDESLPPDTWLRIWPYEIDADADPYQFGPNTGRYQRMDGGAALSDATGSAIVIIQIPDGDPDGQVVVDISVTTTEGSRLYSALKFARPALDPLINTGNGIVDLPAGTALPANLTDLYIPEAGTTLVRGTNALLPGQTLIGRTLNGNDVTSLFSINRDTLDEGDRDPEDILQASNENTTILTTAPAFQTTTPGDMPEVFNPQNDRPTRIHHGRDGVDRLTAFGAPIIAQENYSAVAYARDTATGVEGRGVIGAIAAREAWHESTPIFQGHPGVNAAPEIHAEGVALRGEAADALEVIMRERMVNSILDYIRTFGTELNPSDDTDGDVFSVILETFAPNTLGELALHATPPSFSWSAIETWINARLPGGTTVSDLLDQTNFDEEIAKASLKRLLDKIQKGRHEFLDSALGAINRAEDFIYLQTPCLDTENWPEGTTTTYDFTQAIANRMAAQPALVVILCVPEAHLPVRFVTLDTVREKGVKAAFDKLQAVDPKRVAMFTPMPGHGREHHMASTSLFVDDVYMATGSTHCWRRGLGFDQSVSTAHFDLNTNGGRSAMIQQIRRQIMAKMLGIDADFIPATGREILNAILVQNRHGGFSRVNPKAHRVVDEDTNPDPDVYNPKPDVSIVALAAALSTELRDDQ